MIEIAVDRRLLKYEADTELLELAVRQAEAVREAQIALAKTLLVAKRKRAFIQHNCSSIEMFGGRLGLEGLEVRRLVALAAAMEAESSVEERLRKKALSVPRAAEIAPLLTEPQLFAEKSDWVNRATLGSYSAVRRDARRRMAEIRCGEPVETIEVRVPDSVVERFERARFIASEKAGRSLSRDETFEAVVDFYVDENDPALKREGARRVGDTNDLPGSRYIPISVKRAIRRRAGDFCEFPGCGVRRRLQFAHRSAHRGGSGREEGDLFLLCWTHHLLQEPGGIVVPIGPTADPAWVDRNGYVLTRRNPGGRPPETDAERRALAELRRPASPT